MEQMPSKVSGILELSPPEQKSIHLQRSTEITSVQVQGHVFCCDERGINYLFRRAKSSGKGKTAAICLPLFSSSKEAATADVISQPGTEQVRFRPLNGGRLRGRPGPRFPLGRNV